VTIQASCHGFAVYICHYIVPGILDELYYFPEKKGGIDNLCLPVSAEQIQFVHSGGNLGGAGGGGGGRPKRGLKTVFSSANGGYVGN
jgi:hypothetical protein